MKRLILGFIVSILLFQTPIFAKGKFRCVKYQTALTTINGMKKYMTDYDLRNLPKSKKIKITTKRPLGKGILSDHIEETDLKNVLTPGSRSLTVAISGDGCLPGEKVVKTFSFGRRNKVTIEHIPNPIRRQNESGTVLVEAELVELIIPIYVIKISGLEQGETVHMVSKSHDEVIEDDIEYEDGTRIVSMPGVLGQDGGIGTVTFIRKNGEEIAIELPWGSEFTPFLEHKKSAI